MKPIRISEKQAFKLLEMCDSLFSNLNIDVHIKIDKDMNLNSYFVDFSKKTEDNQESEVTSIHWFEFCMTHLLNKLCDQWEMSYYNTDGYFGLKHPIDYLYEQFKQLKQNE